MKGFDYKRLIIILLAGVVLVSACKQHEPENGMTLPEPGNLTGTVMDETSILFSWEPVEGALQYSVTLLDAYDGSEVFEPSFITESEALFEGLEQGFSYFCKVRAIKEFEYSAFVTSDVVYIPDPEYESFMMPATEDEHRETLAFPGAEGGGMYAKGGRGGAVCHVTTLDDIGEGSLRAAVDSSAARTIVFDVAGVINLQSELRIRNGSLTIAGQTAPGDGICISGGPVIVDADDVIIRFVRFRPGVTDSDTTSAITVCHRKNVIIDHCSMSWSEEPCASVFANSDFSLQWSIIAESLNSRSGNSGAVWGGNNASFHHNLLAHHDTAVRLDHPGLYEDDLTENRGNADIRNNVIFNWGAENVIGGENGSFNLVGNYYRQGPASGDTPWLVNAMWHNPEYDTGSEYPVLYVSGNVYAGASEADNAAIHWSDQSSYGDNPAGTELDAPLAVMSGGTKPCRITTHSAGEAFDAVTRYAGASLARDDADKRVADNALAGDATSGDDGLADAVSDVGGWPVYSATADQTAALTDTDGDGIPDVFETEYGLDPENASDAKAKTIDNHGRYTNLEMYLHFLVKEIVAAQNAGGTYDLTD